VSKERSVTEEIAFVPVSLFFRIMKSIVRVAKYGACLACRRAKVKCYQSADTYDEPCRRCRSLGEACEFLPHQKGPKPRRQVGTPSHGSNGNGTNVRAPTLASVHRSDILRQTSNDTVEPNPWPPMRSSPYVVIQSIVGQEHSRLASARSVFASPTTEGLSGYDPVDRGIIEMRDAERLFKRCVPPKDLAHVRHAQSVASWSLSLDPVIQNATEVRSKSTFLFTTVCAIAACFCPLSKAIAQPLRQLATEIAGQLLIGGNRSYHIVQAFQLFANYLAFNSYTGDRSWFCGCPVRPGTDCRHWSGDAYAH